MNKRNELLYAIAGKQMEIAYWTAIREAFAEIWARCRPETRESCEAWMKLSKDVR